MRNRTVRVYFVPVTGTINWVGSTLALTSLSPSLPSLRKLGSHKPRSPPYHSCSSSIVPLSKIAVPKHPRSKVLHFSNQKSLNQISRCLYSADTPKTLRLMSTRRLWKSGPSVAALCSAAIDRRRPSPQQILRAPRTRCQVRHAVDFYAEAMRIPLFARRMTVC